MNFLRVFAVCEKEAKEIIRDPATVLIALLMPLVMLFLFGYAVSLDVDNVSIGVVDQDRSPSSRALAEHFVASEYFQYDGFYDSPSEAENALQKGRIRLAVIIPPHFSEHLARGETAPVQLLVDGTYSATANLIAAYAGTIVREFTPSTPLVRAEIRVWYNPALRSATDVIPGLFGVILMAFPPLLTALGITREKQTGSIQQIFASPLSGTEFLAGKLIPYGIIAFLQIVMVIGVGFLWFDVPLKGNIVLLMAVGLIYVFCTVSIGLLVSTITKSQLVAMLLTLIITMMPSFLFSGFLFPIFTMPYVLQAYARIFPALYFVDFSRGLVLKGAALPALWPSALILFIYTCAVFGLAVSRFHKKVA